MCVNKKISNSIYLCNNMTYNLQNVLYSNKFSLHFKSFLCFYENFYENAGNKHSFRDLYLLCRLRTTYNDPKFLAVIPNDLKDKAISLWKAKDKDGDNITVCYKREKEFANIFGVSEKSIKRYYVALEKAGMIKHYYKIKKGIVVISTYLETLLTE